jgi:hypothetical protein
LSGGLLVLKNPDFIFKYLQNDRKFLKSEKKNRPILSRKLDRPVIFSDF